MNPQIRSLNPRRGESGYLLVETLVGSSLLLVAFLAIMPLFAMAGRQNAYAKDSTVGAALALDKAEEFGRWQCKNVRRGNCCKEVGVGTPPPVLSGDPPTCGPDNLKVDGITYRRTCQIRQNIAAGKYNDDATNAGTKMNEPTEFGFPYAGVAWIQVTVTPQRSSHLSQRSVRPTIMTYLRVCQP